jgi:CRP-like cAMP-binding protein
LAEGPWLSSAAMVGAAGSSGVDSLSRPAQEAWLDSFLGSLDHRVAEKVLNGRRETFGAGKVFYRGAHHDEMAMLGLVVEGLLRIFVRSSGGRQATVRYAARGAIVGLPAVLVGGTAIDGEALLETRVLLLSPERFRAVAEREPSLAWATARYVARQVAEGQEILAADLFLPVKARVARHLLDLAQRQERELVVRATHQEIADAIGSVREVASRELKRMEDQGLVERIDGGLRLLDPAALHRIGGDDGSS